MGRKGRAGRAPRGRALDRADAPRRSAGMALALAAIVAAVLAAYSSSFGGVLLGDDVEGIAQNPHVRSLGADAFRAPSDTTLAGRPVAAVSFALNYALASADVRDAFTPADPAALRIDPDEPYARNLRGYHALNLAIHVAATLLLFGVVRRSLTAPALAGRFEDTASHLALAVALLWALHPLNTAAVTYIVQRAEALMGLFLLLTLYAAIRAVEDPRRARLWTIMAVFACAAGMGTKEVMVVAPILTALWLFILWPTSEPALSQDPPSAFYLSRVRSTEEGSRQRTLLLTGLASTWIVLAILVASNPRGESVGLDIGGWTPMSYLVTQAGVIVHYVRLALYPHPLVFTYEWPPVPWSAVVPQLLVLITAAVASVAGLVRRMPVALLGAWFFLILAPSSSLLPIATEVAAEHRMYLPLAAVVTGVVLAIHLLLRRTDTRHRRALAGVTLIVAALALGFTTHRRNLDYWSLETMMRDVVEKRPEDVKPRVTLGGHLLGVERYADAERELRAALELPESPDRSLTAIANMYLGGALAAQGRTAEGVRHLERARDLGPSLAEVHGMLGEAYGAQGRTREAADAWRRAADALPDVPPVLMRAARLLATSPDDGVRDGATAVRLAERAAELTGGQDLAVLDTLGAAYAESGRFAEAAGTARRALDLARRTGNPNASSVFEQRLAWYHAGRPIRER